MATKEVSESSQLFMDKLVNGSLEELNELKAFLFRENIRLEMEKREIQELREKVIADRERLRNESDEVNKRIVTERKRLKEEQMFFDKKMEILKNGFAALEIDRKALNNSRKELEREIAAMRYVKPVQSSSDDELVVFLFRGTNSLLSLKKRYKDLLKLFHPDNMGGDHEMVLTINKVYEELKKNYESSKIV